MNENALDRDWHAGALLRFALPTMVMMLSMGLYTLVDTIFVARFVHTDALSAVNIVCPAINVTVGLGTMLATGGNALISRKLGEGRLEEAREDFTLLTAAGAILGALLFLGGELWLDRLVSALGASERLFPYCRDYLRVLLLFFPANILQTLFADLFVTAGRPGLGFGLSLLAGTANLLLDYVFIVPLGLGIRGAALGTGIGYLLPAAAGLVYFGRSRGTLAFTHLRWRWRVLWESCSNGSSEMVSQLASAVTTFLFNAAMLDLAGEEGVAAITIAIYAQFLLNTLYIGFSIGVAPVIGFNWGRRDRGQLRRVVSASLRFLMGASVLLFLTARLGGRAIVGLFAEETSAVWPIAVDGFRIFSYSFLFCGLNSFTSALFTALSNGKLSALLSFLRTFGLLAGGIVVLSRLWGVGGVWLAVPAAEGLMLLVSLACLARYRNRYGY